MDLVFDLVTGGVWMYVYFLAAVVPAAALMIYIYRVDSADKEPPWLLMRCILGGVLAAFAAVFLETVGENVLFLFVAPDRAFSIVLLAFLIVAVAEELSKFAFLKAFTWRNPNFNYRFDGIVYAVFVSLGFAAFENIGYVLGYGLSVAPWRALLAIPGHMSFAVFMGYFYGRARLEKNRGNAGAAKRDTLCGLLAAIFLHGFYDSCAMMESTETMIGFIVFVIIVDILMFLLVRSEAKTDQPI